MRKDEGLILLSVDRGAVSSRELILSRRRADVVSRVLMVLDRGSAAMRALERGKKENAPDEIAQESSTREVEALEEEEGMKISISPGGHPKLGKGPLLACSLCNTFREE